MVLNNQQRSARYVIFHKKYLIKINYFNTLNINQIKRLGFPTSDIEEVRNTQRSEKVIRPTTIADMAEYACQGTNFSIIHYNDVKEIYNVISEHLDDYANALNQSLVVGKIPVEDLHKLSEFASMVYKNLTLDDKKALTKEDEHLDLFNVHITPLEGLFDKQNNQATNKEVQENAPHLEKMKDIDERKKYRRQQWLKP